MAKTTAPPKANTSSAIPGEPSESVDRVAKSAHRGIEAASQAAHPAVDRMVSGAHKAVDSADDAANQAVKALDNAGVKGEEMIDASTGYMRKHPVFTLGIAVTAGYVLSRLLTSR